MKDEEKGSGKLLTILLVAAVVLGGSYLVTAALYPIETPTMSEALARQWADRMGIRVTGVECNAFGSCTIARGDAVPIVVSCGGATCTPKTCQ